MAPTPSRQLSYAHLISVNLWLLVFPCDLCCDWTMGTIPLIESVTDPRNATTLAAVVVIGLLCHTALTTSNRQQATVLTMVCLFPQTTF